MTQQKSQLGFTVTVPVLSGTQIAVAKHSGFPPNITTANHKHTIPCLCGDFHRYIMASFLPLTLTLTLTLMLTLTLTLTLTLMRTLTLILLLTLTLTLTLILLLTLTLTLTLT